MRVRISLFFLFFFIPVYGGIRDQEAHARNQTIFANIIQQRLEEEHSIKSLFLKIHAIGEEALKQGFKLDAYTFEGEFKKGGVYFSMIPIYEGEAQGAFTFFIFVWPSKVEAIEHCKTTHLYETSIHAHPIPCAFTVLDNTITQKLFTQIGKNTVSFSHEQTFHKGEGEVDLVNKPFIHQMFYDGRNGPTATTLHIYGGANAREVKNLFRKFDLETTFFLE